MDKQPKHIPSDIRGVSVRFSNYRNMSGPEIARKIKANTGISFSRAAYSKLLKKYRIHGSTMDLPRSGRPPKMSLYHFDYIDKRMVQNDELTAKELACDFLNAFGLKISVPAMNKIRNKLGWRKAGTKYCQVVSEKNRTSRLHFTYIFHTHTHS